MTYDQPDDRFGMRQPREAANQRPYSAGTGIPDFQRVFSARNLYRIGCKLRRVSGTKHFQGVSFDQLSAAELSHVTEELAASIQNNQYQPQPPLLTKIPKHDGTARTLMIPGLIDRLVGAALYFAFQRLAEDVFVRRSYGFRPKKSTWHLLADLAMEVQHRQRPIVLADDLVTAFDSLRIKDVIKAHGRLMPEKHLLSGEQRRRAEWLEFIERCLRASTTASLGIGQGYPYSPLAMNLTLHFFHDFPRRNPGQYPWFRFADNFARCVSSQEEIEESRDRSRRLLEPLQLQLHKEQQADLSQGETIEILGYQLFQEQERKRVQFDLGDQVVETWREKIESAHEAVDPPRTANSIVTGLITTLAPLSSNRANERIQQLIDIASGFSFKIENQDALNDHWRQMCSQWETIGKRAWNRFKKTEGRITGNSRVN